SLADAEPLAQVVEEPITPLEERADGGQRQVAGLLIGWRPFPGEAQQGQLGPELIVAGKRSPVPVADHFGPVGLLKLPQLIALLLAVLGLVELRLRVGQQEVHRFVELPREVILPLGVRMRGLIGRAVRGLSAVDEADQADDRVAVGDPLLELGTDLLVSQVEDLLEIDDISALAQGLAGQSAIALEVARGGADEDAGLGHGSRSLPTRRPAMAETLRDRPTIAGEGTGPRRVHSTARPGWAKRGGGEPTV